MLLKETISHFLDKDVIIISGGVSKGDADYVPEVLTSLGVKEIFHGVKLKPGAPLWFGYTRQGGVIFGLPGNPLSVQTACRIFIEPYLCSCFRTEPILRCSFLFLLKGKRKANLMNTFPAQW
jgi:molybdopterin molybdotransferase